MIGLVFGRLTVLSFSHYDRHHRKHYLCRCVCGVTKTVQMSLLRSGNTKSCGCLGREHLAANRARLPNDGGVINHLILQYRRHARDRGFSFAISRELFDRLVRQPCVYCGASGSNLKITKNCRDGFRHNGIDRIDASRGYEPDNVVTACRVCNVAKGTMSRAEFIAWASRVAAMADQWGTADLTLALSA